MATLLEVEKLARELNPADQARLIQFLAPRVAAVHESPTANTDAERSAAWERLSAIGNRLAATQPGDGSITDAVSEMRR
jgi:hypothetical protein